MGRWGMELGCFGSVLFCFLSAFSLTHLFIYLFQMFDLLD